MLLCSAPPLNHISAKHESNSTLFILFSVFLNNLLGDGPSLHAHVVEVDVKNELFVTTPSPRINAHICNYHHVVYY